MIVFQKYKSQARFLVVGGSSTLLDFIIYMLLSTKLNITISKFISMTVSSIYSFLINKNWTFENGEKINKTMIIKYIGAQLLNIFVNTSINTIIYTLTNNKLVSFVIATATAMIVNYFSQKIIVFKKEVKK